MRYATSIKFGGELIHASECDYEDYKKLGLLCPECKEPVFLRSGSTYKRQEKEILINPHFAHFSHSDPTLVKICENRVNNYDEKELQRRVAVARGQRLKLLQRWFWSIFKKNMPQSLSTVATNDSASFNEAIKLIKDNSQNLIDELVFIFRTITEDDVQRSINRAIDTDINQLKSPRVVILHKKLQGLDLRMQKCICWEVIQFLKVKSSLCLLEDCLACVVWMSSMSPTAQQAIDQGDIYMAASGLMTCLVMIFWAEEFSKLNTETRQAAKFYARQPN